MQTSCYFLCKSEIVEYKQMSCQLGKVCCPLKISCCLGALVFFRAKAVMLPESGFLSSLNFESQKHLQGQFLEYLWIFITLGHLD